MKTTCYGGTFDPPHLGHLRIGESVLERGLAEKVLFMPAWIPPHKQEMQRASFEDRFRMLELLTEGHPGLEVSDFERRKGGISYTIETLRILRDENPNDEFRLLVGSDSLRQLHSWYKAEELADEFPIFWYPRGGENPVTEEELRTHWKPETAARLFAGVIPGIQPMDVSSTGIREVLRKGERSEWISDKIGTYIRKRSLYEYGRKQQ